MIKELKRLQSNDINLDKFQEYVRELFSDTGNALTTINNNLTTLSTELEGVDLTSIEASIDSINTTLAALNTSFTTEGNITSNTGNLIASAGDVQAINGIFSGFSNGDFKQLVTFASSGIYIPSAGVRKIRTTLSGAGGGAGGAASTGTGKSIGGHGGGSGVSIRWFDVSELGASETVTIGAGGIGGSAGNNNGTDGGTTSFGSYFSATGGKHGFGGANTVGPSLIFGGQGGTGIGGDYNFDGQEVGLSRVSSNVPYPSSISGGNHFNCGKRYRSNSGNGANVSSVGVGGLGGINYSNSNPARSGGDGGDGFCWIEEYY